MTRKTKGHEKFQNLLSNAVTTSFQRATPPYAGWSFGRGKKRTTGTRKQQGTIVRYEVPYSEHSSFSELRTFVRLIRPANILPHVNNDGGPKADAMIAELLKAHEPDVS
jgi:hypothetical protein